MRRILVPVAAAALLTVGGAGVAFATDNGGGGDTPSGSNVIIHIGDTCGTGSITFTAPVYGDKYAVGDWWVGDEATADGKAMPWSGQPIKDGPYAGQNFPAKYHKTVPIKDGSVTVQLSFDEDSHGGTAEVHARIAEGPEQKDYVLPKKADINTNCEADTTTTTAPPATSQPATPPVTQSSTPTTSNTQGAAVPTTKQNGNGDNGQVSKTPVGAVDTGYGSTAGIEDAWLYGLGGAVALAGAGLGLIAARRRKSHQQ